MSPPSKITYTSQWGRNPVYTVNGEYTVSMCPEVIAQFLALVEVQGVHLAWLEFTGRDVVQGGGDSQSVFLLSHEAWRERDTTGGETNNNEQAIDEALRVLNYGFADSASYGTEGNYEGRLLLDLSKQQKSQLTRLRQLVPQTMSLKFVASSTTATLTCVGCPIPEKVHSCLPSFFSRRDIDGNPDMNWKVSAQFLEEKQIWEFLDKQVSSPTSFRTNFCDPLTLSHHLLLLSYDPFINHLLILLVQGVTSPSDVRGLYPDAHVGVRLMSAYCIGYRDKKARVWTSEEEKKRATTAKDTMQTAASKDDGKTVFGSSSLPGGSPRGSWRMCPMPNNDSSVQHEVLFSRFRLAPGVLAPLVSILEPLSISRGLFGACAQKLLVKTESNGEFMKVRLHFLPTYNVCLCFVCLFVCLFFLFHDVLTNTLLFACVFVFIWLSMLGRRCDVFPPR